jgi:hypothetical protein
MLPGVGSTSSSSSRGDGGSETVENMLTLSLVPVEVHHPQIKVVQPKLDPGRRAALEVEDIMVEEQPHHTHLVADRLAQVFSL